MSYSTWPSTLPQYPSTDYSEPFVDALLETDMDTGPSKRRLRCTAMPRTVQFSMHMTLAQLADFKIFFNTTLTFGLASFYFPLPPDSASTLVRFKKGSPPQYASEGVEARITMTLEVQP